MDKKVIIKFNIIAIISIIIIAICVTPISFQNDTFYTIKIGEQIAENGIDMQEHFSWHEGLEYTYPHWLYDLITYHVYNFLGFKGIYILTCILSCILGISLYLINVKRTKNHLISFIISVIMLLLMQPFLTARAQLVTFILFLCTYYFIEMFLDTKKKRYAIGLIIIPILIVNLHLAVFPFYFILYLPYLAEYFIASRLEESIYKKKYIAKLDKKIQKLEAKNKINKKQKFEKVLQKIKERNTEKEKNRVYNVIEKLNIKKYDVIKTLIIIMIICLFTGFLTPLGTTPYTYLIKTLQGNTTLHISEHQPIVLAYAFGVLAMLVIVLAILIFTNVKIRVSDLCMFAGLTLLTIMSRRQASMLYLIGGIVLCKLVVQFINNYSNDSKDENSKPLTEKITSKFGICLVMLLVLNIGIIELTNKVGDTFVDEKEYPVQACDYILENLNVDEIKLYNEYNYGSYILYRDIPVFIDSRADLYSPEFNEGINLFTETLEIMFVDEFYGPVFEKYGITHLLLKNDSYTNRIVSNVDTENYTAIYSDEYFTLYEKNNT